MLLQVLDDGRLTDSRARAVNLRNTVLIMTSNVQSPRRMREIFRPRVPEPDRRDRRVPAADARPDRRDRRAPATRLERGSPSAAVPRADRRGEGALAEAGWDPTYGARPLKRAIQRLVENPLALRLLEGDFARATVRVDAQDGELVFEKAVATQPAAA